MGPTPKVQGQPKLPRKIKKSLERYNWGLVKYRKTNKFFPKKGSIARRICEWYYGKQNEWRGYHPDEEITKHRLFKLRGYEVQ